MITTAIRRFATRQGILNCRLSLALAWTAHAFHVSGFPVSLPCSLLGVAAMEIISEDSSRRHDPLVQQPKRLLEPCSRLVTCTFKMADVMGYCMRLQDLGD